MEAELLDQHAQFEARVRMLTRQHARRSRGVVLHLQEDGLIVARPRRVRVPIVGPVLFVAVFIFFKSFLLASLGQMAYEERLDTLSNGTFVEKLGATVMAPDLVSRAISREIRPYLQ